VSTGIEEARSAVNRDEHYIRRSLELAARARCRTHPNPLVGAVIVSGGRVVGEGFHRGPGRLHAEIEAITVAGDAARGATMYLNLEPCCHFGKTPPCTDAILRAGISRVVFSIYDPDERVRGRGAAILSENGIVVETGVGAKAALELNLPYAWRRATGEIFVTLKLASTLDGRMTAPGLTWLTGERARRDVHVLRADAEAIAVGIGTIEQDRPILDRRFYRTDLPPPVRMIFDSRLRFPTRHPWLDRGERVIVYCAEGAPVARMELLEAAGAEVVILPPDREGVDLHAWRAEVGRQGITSVLVEGGGRVATSLIRNGCFERLSLYFAPIVSGSKGMPWFLDERAPRWSGGGELVPQRVTAVGEDAVAIYERRAVIERVRAATEEGACVHGAR
jgi:diaminohydroxyphosphoribosylaminopyrimidine deaminase/5-amino-6-(5-phosphoribosylamino)uracil reductase